MMLPPPGVASGSKMPPEVLAQKSQKWIQMQNRRYGEKRKGGYVDMGKQVSVLELVSSLTRVLIRVLCRTCLPSMCGKSSRTMVI
jgi:hypothetical protein